MQPITALPEPLLEKILLPGTNTKDKTALRQTCKYIQKVLDTNLVCIQLLIDPDERQENFMKRMQHFPYLKEVGLKIVGSLSADDLNSLLTFLPKHLTSLNLYGIGKDFGARELARLPCLTALRLNIFYGKVIGMEHISGLRRLHCNKPIGSLAHLAPTLKHLSIGSYNHVQGMNQLTNLEVLEMFRDVPENFFYVNRKLPLKHLCLPKPPHELLHYSTAWKSAPTTLTCLTLGYSVVYARHFACLPASITHLQLLNGAAMSIEQLAAALPGLRCLDLCIGSPWGMHYISESLRMFTNLQSLCICIDNQRVPDRLVLKEVAAAVARGMHLSVIETPYHMINLPDDPQVITKSAWMTPA